MAVLIDDIKREIYSCKVKAIDSIVFLTYRCTSKCKTCNIWKRNADENLELDWDHWKRVFTRLKEYGIETVELFGGDALLRKDIIFKIIRFCRDNGIETYFPTNSILLDRETANRLVEAGLGTIYISLDGAGNENDKIRGKDGSFSLVKRAIENIVSARGSLDNPEIIICSTISNMNYDCFEQIVDFLKDYPINAIYPRCVGEFSKEYIESSEIDGIKPEPFFMSSENTSHLLIQNEVDHFRKSIYKLKIDGLTKRQPYINFRNMDGAPDAAFTSGEYGIKRCQVCTTLMTINPNGDVIPCFFYPGYVLGNADHDDMDKIWGNKKHEIFIRHQRSGKIRICNNCLTRTYYPTLPESIYYYMKRTLEKIRLITR